MHLGKILAVMLLAAGTAKAADLHIRNVTIVSPERAAPLGDVSVTIRDGRIAAIGAAAAPAAGDTVIDASGLFLTPGLIDSHVHPLGIPGMTSEQQKKHPAIAAAARAQIPRSYLRHGFTTLLDLIATPQRVAQWKSAPLVPDTYFCGPAFLQGGYGAAVPMPYILLEPGMTAPAGSDPARHTPAAVVARIKADGASCVKTAFERGFAADRNQPVPKLETIRELVRAAHAEGLPVLMHGNSVEAHAFGVAAGVDVMVHGMWNSAPTDTQARIDTILDDIVMRNIGWQPTIQVLSGIADLFKVDFLDDPELKRVLPQSLIDWYGTPEGQWFHDELAAGMGLKAMTPAAAQAEIAKRLPESFGLVRKATADLATRNARLLFGTDTPSAPTYANPPGLNGLWEIRHWAAAGVTPVQIFRAATLANAQALKLDREIGTVEVGKRANLLLLTRDPTRTIEAYDGIEKVILGGRVLEPAELDAGRSAR